MSELAVPDFTQPIIGWRGWYIDGVSLVSFTRKAVWPTDGPLEALCSKRPAVNGTVAHLATDTLDMEINQRPDAARWTATITMVGSPYDVTQAMRAGIRVFVDDAGEIQVNSLERTFEPGPLPKHVDPPHLGDTCGIYAVAGFGDIPPNFDVCGAVELTGKVIPGEKGWRAQRARVIALSTRATQAGDGGNLEMVAENYGVPLVDVLPPPTDPQEVFR